MQEITITQNDEGQRLDRMLAKYLKEAPDSFLYKMLRKKNITLNGRKASGSERLANGDKIALFFSEETLKKFTGDALNSLPDEEKLPDGKPDIVYEDEQILLFNKPAGMLSQKAEKTDVSAVEYLTAYLLRSGQISREALKTFRPGVCNRLDRNTSGILAMGKTLPALRELNRFFKERTIAKYYLCLVQGILDETAEVKGYLYKDARTNRVKISRREIPGGTGIETHYRPVCSGKNMTLLEVHLITGKSHQIRAHLASEGHPVIGDYKYGVRTVNDEFKRKYGLSYQLLHAWRIQFPPSQGVLKDLSGKTFTAQLPELFEKIGKAEGVL